MCAFVRDGAVNRKRRVRPSLAALNSEPEKKKIHKSDDDRAIPAPPDLASITLRKHSGENSVNQSPVVPTEKESRYSDVEFMRARAFSYLNYKKISSFNVNPLLKEHLKKFDKNETHLKRTFEQCYNLTGSIETSKDMMEKLGTNPLTRLDLKPNIPSGVSSRRLSILPCKVVEKSVKKLKKMKNKKSIPIRLEEKIDEINLILFGEEYSTKDKKVLHSKNLNDYIKARKIDYDSDTTIISDDEEGVSCMLLTKAYSLHNTKINSFEVTQVTNPNTGIIVRINSNLLKHNPQSNTFCAKRSISATTQLKTMVHKKLKKGPNVRNSVISATTQLKTSVHKKFKKGPNVRETENSQISASSINNLEKVINPHPNVQNAEGFSLKTVNDVPQIIVPQFKIDGIVKNSKKVLALETNIQGENAVPKLKMHECVQNAYSTALDTKTDVGKIMVPNANSTALDTSTDGEMMIPKLIIGEIDQNANSTALDTKTDLGKIMVPKLIRDEIVQNFEGLVQNIDDVEITDSPLIIDESVQNAYSTALDIETDVGKIMVPKLIIDESVQNFEGLVQNIDDVEITDSPLIIDESVQNAYSTALDIETDVGEIMVPKLIIDESVQNFEGLVQNIDDVEITDSPLIIDESVQNANSTALDIETDVEEIMVPKLIIDESVQNFEGLVQNIDDVEITDSPLIIDESVQNANSTALDKLTLVEEMIVPKLIKDEFVQNSESSVLVQDNKDGEITVSPLIIDERVKNINSTALKMKTPVGTIIDPELEKSTSSQDLVDSQINTLEIDTDIDDSKEQSEIMDYANIELQIRKIINTDDKVFKNSIIKDLATYFLNDDFLSKADTLWKTTESELVGELVLKLIEMFNGTENNMAQFTGCLICIFREIAHKSSIHPSQMKLKLIIFLDAIKKYIKFYDDAFFRTWLLPSMFFDWCFVVAFIFMNSKNEFKIDLNKSVIKNATEYYRKVKGKKYLFIHQDLKPSRLHKKSGIFELTRINDLLEIDDVYAINNTKVLPNISIDITSDEPELKKHKMDENCMDTINHPTTPGDIEEVCPAPVYKISVCSQFNYSNAFINKLNWFNGNVSELMKRFNVSTSNKSIESSTIQNNTTAVGNNILVVPSSVNKPRSKRINVSTSNKSIESFIVQDNTTVVGNNIAPSSVNKPRSKMTSAKNKPTKSKNSKTHVESPRAFFTIANNPKEFDITYRSSAITQQSSSSAVSKNVSSSSTVPKNSSLSAAVPQSLSSSTVSQNFNPYYNNFSSSNTSSQIPVTLQNVVPRSLSSYYNNINSNITQPSTGLQSRPSISNTTLSSNARGTKPAVDMNIISIPHPFNLSNQHSAATNSQLPKAANTWPSNIYNICRDPSCSKSSTCHTEYTNSASSYSQSLYSNYNIPSATSHPQHSNALTYPTTYTCPIINDPLASNTSRVAAMNTYMQQQNYNYRNYYSSQNNLETPNYNTQVSPDLPDARLPNMPNHQDANIINKMCMAANCTNTSSFSCNACLAAFYCSIQCQKSDWHYHQNECCVSF